eukprot:gene17606-23939_t
MAQSPGTEAGPVACVTSVVTRRARTLLATRARPTRELHGTGVRLLSLHASSCAAERNWSTWGRMYTKLRSNLSHQMAEKLIFIKSNYDSKEGGDMLDMGL